MTLPNFILSWALHGRSASPALGAAFSPPEEGGGDGGGELDLSPEVLGAFVDFLSSRRISLRFLSGAWSPEFVDLVAAADGDGDGDAGGAGRERVTVVVGAETIYSPFALGAFAQTLLALLRGEKARGGGSGAEALVGAKKLYFGVGGSLDDFVARAGELGAVTEEVWEETEGVRRGVVRCSLP